MERVIEIRMLNLKPGTRKVFHRLYFQNEAWANRIKLRAEGNPGWHPAHICDLMDTEGYDRWL